MSSLGGAPEPFKWGHAKFNGEIVYEGPMNRVVVASLNAQFPAAGLRIHSVTVPVVDPGSGDPGRFDDEIKAALRDQFYGSDAVSFEEPKVFASEPIPLPAQKVRPNLRVVTDSTEETDQPQPPRPTGGFKPRIVK